MLLFVIIVTVVIHCVCMMCIGELVRSEDILAESAFSFHIYMGSGAQTLVIRLVWQVLDC